MTPTRWLLLAVLFRVIAAATQISTWHPDEWFQTVEFGNFMAFGFLGQTNEFVLHMRNLTWPALIAIPLKISRLVAEDNLFLRVYGVKILTGLLDLSILWGLWKLLDGKPEMPNRWKQFAFALFVLPYFTIADSVRPSQEHMSAVACWIALGLLARTRQTALSSLMVGVFIVLTGTFRYPSGLLGLGILIAIFINGRIRIKTKWLMAGLALGLLGGGLTDWIVYGRPWESLWMYLQYNVFTGISSRDFGVQSANDTYFAYFKSVLGGPLLPIGIASLALAPIGLFGGFIRVRPWALATTCYFVGHLLIPHKESRFMFTMLALVLWATVEGAWIVRQLLPVFVRKVCVIAFVATLAVNSVFLVRALWGETWRLGTTFLELGSHLKNHQACAVVSVRRPLSTLLPWQDALIVPAPPVAFFPAPAHHPSSESLADRPLIWIERAPSCRADGSFLFQPQQAEEFWTTQAGCKILPSGPLKFAPRSIWDGLIRWRFVSAPWYSCPATALSLFKKQEVRRIIGRKITKFKSLPPLGITADQFLKQAKAETDPQTLSIADATLGDW